MKKIALIPLILCSAMANANPLGSIMDLDPDFTASAEYLQWEANKKAVRDSLENKCSHLSKNERVISQDEREHVIEIVKETLNDPFSAEFRNITKSSEYHECFYNVKFTGQVNSKNLYGGYAGYQRFDIDVKNIKWNSVVLRQHDADNRELLMLYLKYSREKRREEFEKKNEARKKSWVCVIAFCR